MTTLKLLSAALIASAVLATPAMARESHVTSRHLAEPANANTMPDARHVDGHLCSPAPRMGASSTQPSDNNPPCEPVQGY